MIFAILRKSIHREKRWEEEEKKVLHPLNEDDDEAGELLH